MTPLAPPPATPDVRSHLVRFLSQSDRLAVLAGFWVVAAFPLEAYRSFNSPAYYVDQLALNGYPYVVDLLATQALDFLEAQWATLILALVTYRWFRNYRRAVGGELEILDSLFLDAKPYNWDDVTGRKAIPFLAAGLVVTFLALAAALGTLLIYLSLMMALWLMDLIGNANVQANLNRHLSDPAFLPDRANPLCPTCDERRAIARAYWIERPQLLRIGVLIGLTVLLFLLEVMDAIYGWSLPDAATILPICLLIMGNEITMRKWRAERDAALLTVIEKEAAINRVIVARRRAVEERVTREMAADDGEPLP